MNSEKSPPAPRTPKKSLRKKRPLSTLYSPTLFTPDVKKNNRTSRKTNRKEWKAWTTAEKRFVIQYTDSKSIGNINWEECATLMERSLGTKRSAISCQTIFSRMEEDSYIEISVESKDISVQTDISLNPREKFAFAKMSEFEQQTEFVPYTSQTLHQLLSECDRTNMPEDPLPGKNFLSEDRNDVCMSNTEMLEHNYNQPLPTTFPHNDNNQQVPSDPLAHLSLSDHNYITNNSKLGKNKIRNSKVIPSQSAAEMISSLTVSQIARLKIILNSKRPKLIASTVLDMSPLKQNIVQIIANKSSKVADSMKNRIHNTSVLMAKDPNSLKSLEIKDIVEEFEQKLPELYKIVYSMMCPYESVTKEQIIPRLATVYSVIMFTRNMELSRLQRVVGCCLLNSICDQKVYDRLNRLGVSISYSRILHVCNQLGGQFNDVLIDAIQKNKRVRFVGDNLNFSIGVYRETHEQHKHMVHMFASAALISDRHFLALPNIPQIPLELLSVNDILLSKEEYLIIRKDMVKIVVDTLAKHVPQLAFMAQSVPSTFAGPDTKIFSHKTQVIPLPVLPYNEQCYQDTVKILDFYEDLVNKIGGVEGQGKFQIGGDQLTRERFSGAINLRLCNPDPAKRFDHLFPTTFEFFHLCMNFLDKCIIDTLWNSNGMSELGTLKCEVERNLKSSFDIDVMKAYDTDKDFIIAYTNAIIAEAGKHFFGIADLHVTKNIPPHFDNFEEEKNWVYNKIGQLVDQYIFPCWSGNSENPIDSLNSIEDQMMSITLLDGSVIQIPIVESTDPSQNMKNDKIKDYFHHALEVGCIFKLLLQLLKTPDRQKILSLFKIIMILLWGKNKQAKYPLEILRMLLQQYSLLGLQEACQVLHACFVNTGGKSDTNVPADLQMEWIVKDVKSNIKHMYSNKTDVNINNRSAALPFIKAIGEQLDKNTAVVVRSKKHKNKGDMEAEKIILNDLKIVNPFAYTEGRAFRHFSNITKSQLETIDWHKLQEWFHRHKNRIMP